MKKSTLCFVLFLVKLSLVCGALSQSQFEERTKLKGTYNEEEHVFKASFPRTDIQVTIDSYPATPFMGLTTWASFVETRNDEYMVMGDFTLLQDEVNPVLSLFLDHGIQVTALHNHFFFDQPKVYYMHIAGMGKLEALAEAVREVLAQIQKIRKNTPTTFGSDQVSEKSEIDPAKIEKLLGMKVQAQEGRVKVVVGKEVRMMPSGMKVGKEMGINSWAVFSGTEKKAIINGDVVCFERELQPTLKLFRAKNIQVVAIHNHMAQEEPRLFYVHYWGIGSVEDLALTFKDAFQPTQETQNGEQHGRY